MSAAPTGVPAVGNDRRRPSAVQPVESVRRALRVLRCFDVDHPELGVTQIAELLGIHKATVHRLLTTLEVEDFVCQTAERRYRLGFNAYRLGLVAVPGHALQAVQVELQRLVAETGETAHFAVLDGNEVLYVEKVEGSHRLRLPSAVGRRVPAHCTALGKVLLASMTASDRLRILGDITWEKYTPRTIIDPVAFADHLQTVLADGVGFDEQEFEEGLTCAAAPVRGPTGAVVAGVSISGPSPRFERHREMYVAQVMHAAEALQAKAADYLQALSAKTRA